MEGKTGLLFLPRLFGRAVLAGQVPFNIYDLSDKK